MIIDSLDFSNNISAVKKSNLRSSHKAAVKAYGAQSSARSSLGKDSVSISPEAMELSQIDNFSLEQLLANAV